uniref:Uncharacterized protein n=1 Tax=Arundo donax TaxID=35708 RepID=A0A0A8YEL7_ARUDO
MKHKDENRNQEPKLEFSDTYASCHLYDPNSWLNL